MRNLEVAYLVFLLLFINSCSTRQGDDKPNFIIIYADDMGYGDISSFGNPSISTPRLDRMAEEGAKLTNFMVPANVCTPSRAALMTACWPKRISLHERVLFPNSKHGINPNEELLPELLKDEGYSTAIFGKWHLGHQRTFLPLQNGFDEYFGIPFSNDMSRTEQEKSGNRDYLYDLPLIAGNDTVEMNPDQKRFTGMFTDAAIEFIEKNRGKPFFIYIPHPMPHIPIYASDSFTGRSAAGVYGDVIEEIDHNIGKILDYLTNNGLHKNTMVLFTSDNGPWLSFKTHGGSAGPLNGGKHTTFEGGHRVPCIIWWPGKIEPGKLVTTQLTNMDILPTIMNLVSGCLPAEKIDGQDIGEILWGNPEKVKPYPFLYYSHQGFIQGIRLDNYKYLLIDSTEYLFDIDVDFREKFNLIDQLPGEGIELKELMLKLDRQIESEMRPAGLEQD